MGTYYTTACNKNYEQARDEEYIPWYCRDDEVEQLNNE